MVGQINRRVFSPRSTNERPSTVGLSCMILIGSCNRYPSTIAFRGKMGMRSNTLSVVCACAAAVVAAQTAAGRNTAWVLAARALARTKGPSSIHSKSQDGIQTTHTLYAVRTFTCPVVPAKGLRARGSHPNFLPALKQLFLHPKKQSPRPPPTPPPIKGAALFTSRKITTIGLHDISRIRALCRHRPCSAKGMFS